MAAVFFIQLHIKLNIGDVSASSKLRQLVTKTMEAYPQVQLEYTMDDKQWEQHKEKIQKRATWGVI